MTVVSAGPVTVTKVFEKSKDGYNAVQVGFGVQKEHRVTKSSAGAMKGGFYKTLKEFRLKPTDTNDVKEGDIIDVSTFSLGDKLQVSSVSKGKGFQGVVKASWFSWRPANTRPKTFGERTRLYRRRFAYTCTKRDENGRQNGWRSYYSEKSKSHLFRQRK